MNLSTISVRVNSEDKLKFEKFCEKTGLNVSSAINIYIKAVLIKDPLFKGYTDMNSLRAALEA